MIMNPVISSSIAAIGFENGTMYIQFKHGKLYVYAGIPKSLYKAFISSGSPGSFYNNHIRGRYTRIN